MFKCATVLKSFAQTVLVKAIIWPLLLEYKWLSLLVSWHLCKYQPRNPVFVGLRARRSKDSGYKAQTSLLPVRVVEKVDNLVPNVIIVVGVVVIVVLELRSLFGDGRLTTLDLETRVRPEERNTVYLMKQAHRFPLYFVFMMTYEFIF